MDFFVFILIFACILVGHVAWGKRRLTQWASENKLQLMKSRYCFVNIGPFSQFVSAAGQAIFHIEVKDAAGKRMSGYVRTGGFFFGLLRRRIEVKWDKGL